MINILITIIILLLIGAYIWLYKMQEKQKCIEFRIRFDERLKKMDAIYTLKVLTKEIENSNNIIIRKW